MTPTSLCTALAVATLLVTLSDALSAWLDLSGGRYIILTILTLALATMVPKLRDWCHRGVRAGCRFVICFLWLDRSWSGCRRHAQRSPHFDRFGEHFADNPFDLSAGRRPWLKLTLPELLTASNAAVLGATTAPAMAAAKGWHDQITPGVLVGVLGYSLGTLIGGLLFNVL
ncbi:MAG: hypothetical protein CM15mP103_11110 [Gammaproteobacteria bacterium]|nr:MAG: hypothetical protein CM15mP103_11110 [Gammaproteobacteria bacterium]